MSGPTITIEGKTFTLLCKSASTENESKRDLIVYSSPDGIFCAYRSKSEGLWRLGVLDNEGQFEKGKNYITTTQLHMGLQVFMSSNFDKLRNDVENSFAPLIVLRTSENPKLLQRILTNKSDKIFREYENPVFKLFQEHFRFSGTCFKVREASEAERTACAPTTLVVEGAAWLDAIMSVMGITTTFSTSVKDDYARNLETIISETPMTSSTSQRIVTIISNMMKAFFTCTATSEYVGDIQFGMPGIDVNQCNIFKAQITEKDTGIKFDLYYGRYTFRGNSYKIILNILPVLTAEPPSNSSSSSSSSSSSISAGAATSIGPCGLNSQFISAGIYIYKAFDLRRTAGDRSEYKETKSSTWKPTTPYLIDKDYVFIGDVMTKMWPLKEITDGMLLRKGGGRRRTRSLRKRKQQKQQKQQKQRRTRRKPSAQFTLG